MQAVLERQNPQRRMRIMRRANQHGIHSADLIMASPSENTATFFNFEALSGTEVAICRQRATRNLPLRKILRMITAHVPHADDTGP
jgi:hypothetical protein